MAWLTALHPVTLLRRRLVRAATGRGKTEAETPSGSDPITPGQLAGALITRADAARDARQWRNAAALYEEALRIVPEDGGIRVQCGHMYKEAGELALAEQHYAEALRLLPDDADLALQMGHFYKAAARLEKAHAAYERAAQLQPGWEEPMRELAALHRHGWRGPRENPSDPYEFGKDPEQAVRPDLMGGRKAAEVARLVPALAPRRYGDLLTSHAERVEFRRLGRREVSYWGKRRTLRGVEAIHGFVDSTEPVLEIEVLLNGIRIHRGKVQGGHAIKLERDKDRIRRFVFNEWIDFSSFAYGLHSMEVRFPRASGATLPVRKQVVIAEPVPEHHYPESDTLVSTTRDDPRPVEEQIRTRPSMVRAAKRTTFPAGIRNVLVMRTDQLGDMVASVPALQRLRELLPEANIVGLVTPANLDFARTLGLFDEVIAVDFPDDDVERRRLIPLDAQDLLRRQLAPYKFDIAVDLALSGLSRDLLQLSGAKFYHGFGGEDWPWLTSEFILSTHDRWNRHNQVPHSTLTMALVEALGAMIKTRAPVIRRPELTRNLLRPYGVEPGDRFVLLHSGSRVRWTQWPHFPELAGLLLERTDLKVVIMADDQAVREGMPPRVLGSQRVVFLDQRLPFDDFDAFVSFATAMAANDSGPKHLASLRGTNVVTIFGSRVSWVEWGQENVGAVITRRLPCAGCAMRHDPDECGKDWACITDIKPEEVFDAMMSFVARSASPESGGARPKPAMA